MMMGNELKGRDWYSVFSEKLRSIMIQNTFIRDSKGCKHIQFSRKSDRKMGLHIRCIGFRFY